MPRAPRVDAPGAMHHVIAKGSGGEVIVRDDVDRRLLVERLGKTVLRYRWSCLAYCLLDTHFHVVLGTPAANLGLGMQWLLAPYAREFNKRHERQGNVFHTRFYSKQIQSDDHLLPAVPDASARDEGGLPTSFVSSPYRRNRCRRPVADPVRPQISWSWPSSRASRHTCRRRSPCWHSCRTSP
jgi:hypothetical protein